MLMRIAEIKSTAVDIVHNKIVTILNHVPDLQFQTDIRKEYSEYMLRNCREEENYALLIRNQYHSTIKHFQSANGGEEYADMFLIDLAEIECYQFKDKEKTIELMETYFKKRSHNDALQWQIYIRFMRSFSDNDKMRKLCVRAFESTSDKEAIAQIWMKWEQKY
jgi:hypothetical protein